MADILRIKRRAVGGAAGAPASLAAAEVAYNEQTNILYYGGGNSAGLATSIFPIAGPGAFAPLASPAFTGIPAGPTAAPGTNTTQFATTAFVTAADIVAAGVTTFNTRAGAVTLSLADITGAGGAPLASPVFTGTPSLPTGATAVTQAIGDEDTSLATVQFVARTAQGLNQPNTGDADITFTAVQLDGRMINVIGALTADRTITVPINLNRRNWLIRNGTTGGFNLIITCSGGSSFTIPPGYATEIWSSGFQIFASQSMCCNTTFRIGDVTRNAFLFTSGASPTSPATIATTGTGTLNFGVGVSFGSTVAPGGVADLSRHIALFSTTFGFSITAGRLNYVAPAANAHVFLAGAVDKVTINTAGITMAASTAITLAADPTTALQASTKQYVDNGLAASVVSFNTRTGAISLTAADVTGVGGALLASPIFTGVPSGPTAAPGTNTTQFATTAFVAAADIAAAGVVSFNTRAGAVTLTAADVTGVGGALLAGPTFTGVPAAPTAAPGTNTTQLSTTAFVAAATALYLPLATGGTVSGNLAVSGAALSVIGTSPSGWGMILSNTATNGIILNGTYTGGAIRLSTNMAISFTQTGVRNLYWDNVNNLPAGLKWSVAGVAAPNPVITLADAGYVQAASFYADGASGAWRGLRLLTGGVIRWLASANLTAESTGDVGSDFDFNAYNDAGGLIATCLRIWRSTGLVQFYRGLAINTLAAPGGVTDLSRHINLYNGLYGFNVTANRLNYLAPSLASHYFVVNALDVGFFSSTGLNAAAVGATTPSTGAFTTLAATGAVSGAGFTTLLAPYAPLAAPALTGIPTAPTAAPGTNTTQLATTAFVTAATAAATAGVASWNGRTGTVVLLAADVTGVGGALLAGPTFTGVPAAPTAATATNTTQLATTAFVKAQAYATLAAPALTGVPTAPTAAPGTSTTQLATTAFVQAAAGAYLPLTGGNLTGALQVVNSLTVGAAAGQYSTIYLARQSGYGAQIVGQTIGGIRWNLVLCDTTAETGSNAGSNFTLARYSDAGAYIDSPIFISRATGQISTSQTLVAPGLQSNGIVSANGGNCYMGVAGSGMVFAFYPSWYWDWNSSNGTLVWTTASGAFWLMRTSDWLCYNAMGLVGGMGAYQNFSDVRAKYDVEDATHGLHEVLRLRPVSFKRKRKPGDLRSTVELGFVAQELREVIPEAVSIMGVELPDGSGGLDSDDPTLGMSLDPIVAALVNGMKELAAQNAALTARVQQLETRTLH